MAKVKLQIPILCLVTDRGACAGRPIEGIVAAAVAAGVGLVQLRERDLSAREILRVGETLLEPVRKGGGALVVNDRADVAVVLGADGVHLGGNSLAVRSARKVVGDAMLVGVSVHSIEEAVQAAGEGADYLLLGTIFETRSHPGMPPAGLSLVTEVAAAVRIPLLAIGGVNATNAGSVIGAGASGVAVITAIQSAPDVSAATRALLGAMRGDCRR